MNPAMDAMPGSGLVWKSKRSLSGVHLGTLLHTKKFTYCGDNAIDLRGRGEITFYLPANRQDEPKERKSEREREREREEGRKEGRKEGRNCLFSTD